MVRVEEKKLVDEFLRDTGEKMLMLSKLIGKNVQIGTGYKYNSISTHVFDCVADETAVGSIYSVTYADNELNQMDIYMFDDENKIIGKMDIKGLTDETICGKLSWNNFMDKEDNNA